MYNLRWYQKFKTYLYVFSIKFETKTKTNKTKYVFPKKSTTVTGLEPAIPRSEVWCLIH